MIVKEYDNSQTFLNDFEPLLLEREAVSQLILYNAFHNRKDRSSEKEVYGSVSEEEKAIVIFYISISHDLVIYASKTENIIHAVEALADYLGNGHTPINGITARNDVCVSFMEQYKKHINCTFIQKIGMDIMEIRKVSDIKPTEGIQRLAKPEEAKFIADWMIEFQIEALISELDYEAVVKRAKKYINEKKIYLFENNKNMVVSMVVAERKLVHGMALTYVFTPEGNRGEGYAAANIYYLSKELLDQGYEFCTLFVDKKNPLSSRAYEKVGYTILEDIYEYKVLPVEV